LEVDLRGEHQPLVGDLLSPLTDPSEVPRVSNPDDTDATFDGALTQRLDCRATGELTEGRTLDDLDELPT
jgi:hypothetical protein